MTSDEQFKALMDAIEYTAEELAEVQELEAQAAALEAEKAALAAKATTTKRNGVVYENDGVNADGHTISWYRVLSQGKTILWASVDNDLAKNGPKGHTVHVIRVHNATRTASVETAGLALRGPCKEGTRVIGTTVASFVAPRVTRWVAEFYGV